MEEAEIEEVAEVAEEAPSSTTTFHDLHYYALVSLCKAFSKFSDQLVFAQTCQQVCDIFVNAIWKYEYDKLEAGPVGVAFSHTTKEHHFFFAKQMRTHFTTFVTRPKPALPCSWDGYLKRLRLRGIREYPNVTLCDLKSLGLISEDAMLKFTKLMPNLKKLRLIKQRLTGRNIEKFLRLEELYLEHTILQPNVVNALLRGHPQLLLLDIHNHERYLLPTIYAPLLQTLRLNSDTVEAMMPDIMALPNLTEFEVRYCQNAHVYGLMGISHDGWPAVTRGRGSHNIFPYVIVSKAAKITSITLNNVAVNLTHDWTDSLPAFQMPKLTSLVTRGWQYANLFLDGHLDQSELEVLALGNSRYSTPETLARLVRKYKRLQLLELSHSTIDLHAALKGIESVLKCAGAREHPLMVWNWSFTASLLSDAQLEYWSRNQYVQLDNGDRRHVFMRKMFGFNVTFDNST